METAQEIWEGDLFDRRKEAEDLIGYLECVAARPAVREDGHAHVLAIDSGYGQGKSFFLRRFARQMKLSHAVAFVDAWVDDLEDQPMVALAATLNEALDPWRKKSTAVEAGMTQFREKAGRVAKIVGLGLARRGLSFLITQGGAEALSEELVRAREAQRNIGTEALRDSGSGIANDLSAALEDIETPSMEARIERFREGQQAISDMKDGLGQIVEALVQAGMKLPITIVIDELDRCRPTYAIKLLEEIKHLFDVPGVAFVLGLHGQQLAHSVTAAYGGGFDGAGYLRRFFNRRYTLKEAALAPLVQKLLLELKIPEDRLQYPRVKSARGAGEENQMASAHFIAEMMRAYGLSARDAFELMEIMQTCIALTAPHPLLITYLVPLIIGHMKNSINVLPEIEKHPRWVLSGRTGEWGDKEVEASLNEAVQHLHNAATLSDKELMNAINEDDAAPSYHQIGEIRFNNLPRDSYARPEHYLKLLRTVERFS
jgi:hypothetical protein